MLVIGLTGGIGSGKSTAAQLFKQRSVNVIDADEIAHRLVRPYTEAYQKIVAHFGKDILADLNTIDRKKLGKIVFYNEAERKWLESLLHPLIRKAMRLAIQEAASPYCIVVIPLLLETEKNPLIDRILVIDAPESIQIERAKMRDNRSLEEINAIMEAQVGRLTRLEKANDIIHNDSDLANLTKQVNKLHEAYLKLAQTQ